MIFTVFELICVIGISLGATLGLYGFYLIKDDFL